MKMETSNIKHISERLIFWCEKIDYWKRSIKDSEMSLAGYPGQTRSGKAFHQKIIESSRKNIERAEERIQENISKLSQWNQ